MAWYDSVSGLTCTNAWSAIGHTSAGALADVVGGNNSANWPAAEGGVHIRTAGTGVEHLLDSPISLAGSFTAIALFDSSMQPGSGGVSVLTGVGGGSSWYMFLVEMNGDIYTRQLGAADSKVGTIVSDSNLRFVALTVDTASGNARMYANGAWAGVEFSRAIAPNEMGRIGHSAGNAYTFNSGTYFYCAAIYSSASTLSQLQGLEAAARVAHIIDVATLGSRTTDIQAQRQPLRSSVPASYTSYLTAKEGDISEDKMFVYRSGVWIPVSGVQVS